MKLISVSGSSTIKMLINVVESLNEALTNTSKIRFLAIKKIRVLVLVGSGN